MDERIAARHETRRRHILNVASRIFAERGYRATSMQALAQESGMGKASLYHYFHSKEEVLAELYEHVIRENIVSARLIASGSLSALEALDRVIVDRVVYTCENRELLNVFFEEEAELPDRLRGRLIVARREYEATLMEAIAAGVASGEISISTSPRVVVNTMLGAANWVYKWYDPKGVLTPAEIGRDVSELLLAGIAGPNWVGGRARRAKAQ
jgi:AcrR family transcriptional regulator